MYQMSISNTLCNSRSKQNVMCGIKYEQRARRQEHAPECAATETGTSVCAATAAEDTATPATAKAAGAPTDRAISGMSG
jgi:hypothetical protein